MAITTNFTNLKGNTIKVVGTPVVGANPGDDTTITLGEFNSDGIIEVTPNVRTTVTVQGGKRGVKFFSGSSVPATVIGSEIGDIYLDTSADEPGKSKIYEKISASDPGVEADWQERADFTGATGTSISGFSPESTASALQFVDSDGDPIGVPIDLRGERGTTDIIFDDNPTVTEGQLAVDFDRTNRYTIDITFALIDTLGADNNLQYSDSSGDVILNVYGPRADAGWTPAGSIVADGVAPTPGNPTYETGGSTISMGVAGSDNTQIAADIATVLPDFWLSKGITGYLATSDGPILTISRVSDFGAVTRGIANGEWITTPSAATDTEQVATVTGLVNVGEVGGGGATLYQSAPVGVHSSVVDIVWTKADFVTTTNTGIRINGFADNFTDTSGITDLEFAIDGALDGLFQDVVSTRVRVLVTENSDLLSFLTDAASIINNPSTSNTTPDLNFGETGEDFFNMTASVINDTLTVTLRLTSDVNTAWSSSTFSSEDPFGDAVTINAGYTSVALADTGEAGIAPVADVTYTQGQTVFFPATNPEAYMQLADGSITTTTNVGELPGTLLTWKQIT